MKNLFEHDDLLEDVETAKRITSEVFREAWPDFVEPSVSRPLIDFDSQLYFEEISREELWSGAMAIIHKAATAVKGKIRTNFGDSLWNEVYDSGEFDRSRHTRIIDRAGYSLVPAIQKTSPPDGIYHEVNRWYTEPTDEPYMVYLKKLPEIFA